MRRQLSILDSIYSYISGVSNVLDKLPIDKLEQVIYRLEEARCKEQVVFTCGNGGSAVTAIHFASDLAKGTLVVNKPPIKAKSLCENLALLTAWANDSSFDDIFTETMDPWIKKGDVLIAISSSGESQNVLNAVDMAVNIGASTIGLTGFDGGRLKDKVDICITVPSNSMEQIEDMHLLLCHLFITCLKNIRSDEIISTPLLHNVLP